MIAISAVFGGADQPGLVHPVGQAPGTGGEQREGQDEEPRRDRRQQGVARTVPRLVGKAEEQQDHRRVL